MGRNNPTQNQLLSSVRVCEYAVYVTPGPGERLADGSPDLPFGRLSAQFRNFADQWQQAFASWGTPQDADAEGAWHVVIAEGGIYPDGNLTLRPDIPFQGIVFMGPALVNAGGGIWTWIPSTPRFVVGDPALHVCSVVGGADLSSVLVNGRLRIGDTGAGTAKTFASSGITWGLAVEDDVTQNLGQTNVQIHGGNAHGSLNLAAGVAQIRDAVYGGLVNLTALEWCRDSEFQDAITVAAAGSRALTDTFIAGNFTGPAGSFRADQVTLQNFGGAFAGGASAADVIET